MWKIVTTAISVFLLLSNTVSAQGYVSPQDYIPREFWNNYDEVKKAFDIAVPQYLEWCLKYRPRYECAAGGDCAQAKMIAERTYTHMELYMQEKNLTVPTMEEFVTSIGLQYIPPDFNNLSHDEKLEILEEPQPDILHRNARVFLDYVSGFWGHELY